MKEKEWASKRKHKKHWTRKNKEIKEKETDWTNGTKNLREKWMNAKKEWASEKEWKTKYRMS